MLLIGLTGSIATGKSTVSNILRAPPYSLPIIDADVIARQVVAPGTLGYEKIVAHFSSTTPDLLLDDGTSQGRYLNRPALGKRVFGDSPERKADRAVLNGIVHPAVRWEMYRQLVKCYVTGCWAVVLDVPLLYESGLDLICGTVCVVGVRDMEVQMKRLMGRDAHLSCEDAKNRVGSQGDVREKARRAEAGGGVVVWNDAGMEVLRAEVARVMGGLRRGSPRWWAWLLLLCPPAAGLVGIWTAWRNRARAREWRESEGRARAKL